MSFVSPSSFSLTGDFGALPTDISADANGNSVAGHTARSANYFFGFLVAFVVLFVLFVGCALVSRRQLAARREARLVGRGDPWVFGYQEEVMHVMPLWVERWVESEKGGAEGWAGIMPLSTTVVRPDTKTEHDNENEREKETTGRGSPTSTTTSSPRRTSRFSVSSWLSMTSTSKYPDPEHAPSHTTAVLESNAEVHITIMVTMPLNPETHGPSVYEFGVARVPLGEGGG